MATAETFLVQFPEFATAAPGLVSAVLADAILDTSDSWAERFDSIVYLKTASRLATSPMGRAARLAEAGNVYEDRLRELIKSHACALNRIA